MAMRVTMQTLVELIVANARRHQAELGRLREQMATGLRLNRPSDSPLAVGPALAARAQLARLDAYLANIAQARSVLDVSVSSLREATGILDSARQTALEASQSTNDPAALESLAAGVDRLLDRLLQLANSSHAGQYLFSGTDTTTEPFMVAARDEQGRPVRIVYQGAAGDATIVVGQGQTVRTLAAGSRAFQSRQRGPTVYTGQTGAAPGTGTDNATGEGTLVVRHVATSYAPGSGIQPGTDSADQDTIIGPPGAHTLTVVDTSGDGSSGTVSLDGGPPAAFTNADTNLMVTGPGGEVVYVDTTAITPGFNGQVAITADGTLSTDGGLTEVPITFTSNQIVTDSATGSVTNVDSSNIRRAGTEHLDYTGTYDAFQILISLRDAIRNTRELGPREQAEFISSRVAELDRARDGVLELMGQQSATLQLLESMQQWSENLQLETEKIDTDLQAADLAEVVVSIRNRESLLQLTLAAAARMLEPDLLQFIR